MALFNYAPRFGDKFILLCGKDRAVFNDPADPDNVGALSQGTSGLESPEVRESADDLIEQDGGVHGAFYYGRRSIVLEGTVSGFSSAADRDARLQKLMAASSAMRSDASLIWVPQTRLDNLTKDPSGEVVLSSQDLSTPTDLQDAWAPLFTEVSTTVSTSPAQALKGTRSFIVGGSGTATMTTPVGGRPVNGSTGDVAQPGAAYFIRAGVRAATTPRNAAVGFFVTSQTGVVSTLTGTPVADATGSWTQITYQVTMPSDVYAISPFVQFSSLGASDNHYVDSIQYGPGTLPGSFQDGDTAGWFWHGAPNRSASGNYIPFYASVRRQSRLAITGAWIKTFQLPLVSALSVIQSSVQQIVAVSGTSPLNFTLINRGNTPAYQTYVIEGPITNPSIALTAGGSGVATDALTLTGVTISAGQRAVVNLRNRRAYYADTSITLNHLLNWTASNWALVHPGSTTFQLTGTGTTSATKITAMFRDAWQ